ncbi:MAG: NAD synthetase [Cyanobacteria bacterium P01_D01_bin.6]
MDNLSNLDGLLGIIAIAILLGGLWMLLNGVKSMGND